MNRKRMHLVLPLFFLLFSTWLMTHTMGYDNTQKNILIARSVWSDFGSHIPLIRSFSMGDNFDKLMKFQAPEYPLFSGEPIRYHFLFYMAVGLLEKMGLRLDWALNIPSILGFTLLLGGVWSLAMALFHDKKIALLSIIFFLFNGSLSFFKFFTDHPLSLNTPLDILRANAFPAFGPWDGGMISAFWNLNIYTNQRHLAWGFAIGIWFLIWIIHNQNNHWKKTIPTAILWGVILGILPYFHQPMLIVMAILIGTCFLFFPRLRIPLVLSAVIGLLCIAPQLITMPKTNTFTWYPGYLLNGIPNVATFLSFWFQNLGLHSLLIPIGLFLIPRPARRILFPLFLLFTIGNLFKFSMEVAANHKFFNFALILGNMISAYTIVSIGRCVRIMLLRVKSKYTIPFFIGSIGSIGSICLLVVLLTLSGFIDFFVIAGDTKGTLADVGNDQAATWIAMNTPKDAVFLNSSFLFHPASLAGRKVFMGWPYFAWSAGYDTYKRNDEMKAMFESRDPSVFCPLLQAHHIAYITVEDSKNDPNLPQIDTTYFQTLAAPVYTNAERSINIFASSDLCP